MFSGIIEAVGTLESCSRTAGGARLAVDAAALPAMPAPGDSVSVDGACLTVEKVHGKRIEFALSRETLTKTKFPKLARASRLNLERAVRADQALGGHFVTGHVDGLATVRKIRKSKDSTDVEFSIPEGFENMLVPKGSVAINGVSLTVAVLTARAFSVALVPFTLDHTNLSSLAPGATVHFEADILGKYVVQYLRASSPARNFRRERMKL